MRKSLVAALVLSAVVFGSMCFAGAGGPRLKANIPFAFQAGEVALPAGEYIFEFGANMIIQKSDGSDSYFLNVVSGEARTGNLSISFNRYGDMYYLSGARNGVSVATVLKTRAEKEMAMSFSKGITIAARQDQR